jgi:hypothetical protein
MFVFEGVPHMAAFLMHFHQRIPLLRKLGLTNTFVNALMYRGSKTMERTQLSYIFPWLTGAAELEELHLGVAVTFALSSRSRVAARVLFEQAFHWMHGVGLRKGDRLAVLDVMKLPAPAGGARWAMSSTAQREFRNELAGRLTSV